MAMRLSKEVRQSFHPLQKAIDCKPSEDDYIKEQKDSEIEEECSEFDISEEMTEESNGKEVKPKQRVHSALSESYVYGKNKYK